jgi:hypothetical protein
MPNNNAVTEYLCDHGAGSGALVSPGRRKDADGLVVAGETVDAGFDENETKLGVLVLSVSLEMLANSDSLLDQHVEVLRNLGSEAIGLEDSENLVTSDHLDLSDTMAVTENNTNLTRSCTLLGKLANLVNNLIRGCLQPRRSGAGIGYSTCANSLAITMKATHICDSSVKAGLRERFLT